VARSALGPNGSISPAADGGRPGNGLAGTIFYVNDGATTAITVPAADGKMRFWRNTSIATLAANQTATLPNSTLGYEWDSDLDNGFRPAGSSACRPPSCQTRPSWSTSDRRTDRERPPTT
jgi:hypothetical protein